MKSCINSREDIVHLTLSLTCMPGVFLVVELLLSPRYALLWYFIGSRVLSLARPLDQM